MIKLILKAILKVLFKIQIKGDIEKLKQKNIIITPNHVSFLDGIILGIFLPVRPIFAIDTNFYNHWSTKIAKRYVDFVPMDPTNPLSIKTLVRAAEKGQPVVIFPEGRITITGSLMKIYDGAAFVAAKSNSTIVPIWIEGAEFSLTSRLSGILRQRLFPRITIHIAQDKKLEMPEADSINEKRRILGEQLHQLMMSARMQSCPRHTLIDAYLSTSVKFGAKTKIIQDPNSREITYRKLLLQILGLGLIFEDKTKEKERVGVLLPNAVVTVSTILGLTLKNRVPAMLNYTAGVQSLQKAIDSAQIKLVITSRAFITKGKLEHFISSLHGVSFCYLEDIRDGLTFREKLTIYLCHFFPRFIKRRHCADDDAIVLFTSGSEGTPKGVVHSHASILANIDQIRCAIDPMPTDRFMSALPLFHAFGLTAGLLLPLYSGSRAFLFPNPLQYKLMPEIIYDQNCTILFGTPTFLTNYAKYAHPYDFMQLRYVVAGAEKLSETTKTIWRDKFGIRILEGYGVTECAPVISINVPMNYRAETVGRLLPGIKSKLVPIEGIESGGRLLVKGPNVMKGYLQIDHPGEVIFPKAYDEHGEEMVGFYDTGDIVTIDDDGFISITGRLKRFAKIAGEMVSLEVVELLAKEIDPDAAHCAIVKSDVQKGEAIVLFTTSERITRDALQNVAKILNVPLISVPRLIRTIEALPLLGSGKTDVLKLKEIEERSDASSS